MEYGLIGKKLGHSFSKIIHNKISNYDYQLKELDENELDAFFTKKEFKAINVTIPYKSAVIPYLDSISDSAKAIGAVNTIVNKGGKLYGYNTDFYGMRDLLIKNGIDPSGKLCAVLGTGGTSKTAVCVLNSMGAKRVLTVSRTAKDGAIDYDTFKTEYSDTQIIINTTPCGMYPNISQSAVDISGFKNLVGVADAVYNPLNSYLVLQAKSMGAKAVGGLYMLVAQAVYASQKFLDTTYPENTCQKIYNDLLFKKQNIVLTGMAGCGKSTLGKKIANALGLTFIDTDLVIQNVSGKTPADIIKEQGESAFRDIESNVIFELSKNTGCVIATGGGAVLRDKNILNLKQNGCVVFIERDINDICPTKTRPLTADRDSLLKVYNQRYPIYKSSCDIHAKLTGDANANASAVIERYINEYSFKKI